MLLLDEPAGGVNPTLITHLADRIRELNRAGKTFLVVEHNMEFVMGLCSRITVLRQGTRAVSGTPDEVRSDPAVLDAYLGGEDDACNPARARARRRSHAPAPSGHARAARRASSSASRRALLNMSGVTAGYGGGDILKDVTFDVPAGGHHLRRRTQRRRQVDAAGDDQRAAAPAPGEIRFGGQVVSGLARRQILAAGIAQVPQAHSLFPDMTVRENVEMGAFTVRDQRARAPAARRGRGALPDRRASAPTRRPAASPAASSGWSSSPAA